MAYTLPQAVTFARLADRRQARALKAHMNATRLAVNADPQLYAREVKRLTDGIE